MEKTLMYKNDIIVAMVNQWCYYTWYVFWFFKFLNEYIFTDNGISVSFISTW